MKQREPVSVELETGYTDKESNLHRSVTIGRSLKGRDLLAIQLAWRGQGQTLCNALILQSAITEFGALKIPVSLSVLLSLYSIEFDDLLTAYNEFDAQCGPPEAIDGGVKLVFGLPVGDVVYDTVEFGLRVTGMDYAEADRCGLEGLPAMAYIAGRQVAKLRQGERVIDGPLDLNTLMEADGVDLLGIAQASETWRNSLRRVARVLNVSEAEASARLESGDTSIDAVLNQIIRHVAN